jgi:hypothetical protein
MNEVILHTTDCPQCKILEKKLDAAGIAYTKNHDPEIMLERGMVSAPGLQIGSDIPLIFSDAVKWVNAQMEG